MAASSLLRPLPLRQLLLGKTGATWTATSPPCSASLGGECPEEETWLRLGDLLDNPKPGKLFERKPQPSDVSQGSLADCWLLSSIAALAEFPQRVEQLFVTKDWNREGKYTIQIVDRKTGQPVQITVDDYVPCTEDREPINAQLCNGQMWVALLEKAFAKHYGGYASLEIGRSAFALFELTGKKILSLQRDDESKVWEVYNMEYYEGSMYEESEGHKFSTPEKLHAYISELDRRKCVMCCSAAAGSPKFEKLNLLDGHEYTLIGALRVDNFCLLHLRNPWGRFEWNGDWSDSSDLWQQHPNVKAEAHFENADDGAFWMDAKDFMKAFGFVHAAP